MHVRISRGLLHQLFVAVVTFTAFRGISPFGARGGFQPERIGHADGAHPRLSAFVEFNWQVSENHDGGWWLVVGGWWLLYQSPITNHQFIDRSSSKSANYQRRS